MLSKNSYVNVTINLHRLIIENEKLASELIIAKKGLVFEHEKLTAELLGVNRKLIHDNEKLAAELIIVKEQLAFENTKNKKRAVGLVASDDEHHFEHERKWKRTAAFVVADKELVLAGDRWKRAAELITANTKLALQDQEMDRRTAELNIAKKEKIVILAQLQQSQKLESLGTLAGGVAHDMNNVLGAILGLATAHLEIQAVGSPAFCAFETINKAAVRGGRMVKSLLNFARQSPVEEFELCMNEILREEIRLLEHTTLSKVRLEMDLASDLRPIRGDANALTHAFMNLCVNAVDAMPETGTITLRTRNVDNDWIEVVVEDTGIGMSKDVLEKAMDPFFTTKEEGKGTGLGLSLVHSTVKAHRGQIEIQSEPSKGTRVRMRFPACEPVVQPSKPLLETPPVFSRRALTVLLVDDDELVQSSTKMLLEFLGHTVTAVFSGEDALATLQSEFQPDVVILDINMPGLGGARTLTRLRVLRPLLPVLLATGRVDQAAIDLAGAHSFVALLSKPFSMGELKQHLEPFEELL